jgi:DNA-binding MarR family transcriptional regulator
LRPARRATHAPASPFNLDTYLPHTLNVVASRVSSLSATTYREQFNISIPEWRALSYIGWNRDVSINAVSANTSLDKVAASRAVARLVEAGLVISEPNPDDARLVMLKITAAGKRIYDAVVPQSAALEAAIGEVLGEAGTRQLRELIARLNATIESGELQQAFKKIAPPA